MFELANQAARDAEESDLVAHWIVPGDHRVERHVPEPPHTAEVEASPEDPEGGTRQQTARAGRMGRDENPSRSNR